MPALPGQPQVHVCHGSIAHFVAPLMVGDDPVGSLISTPFAFAEPDSDELLSFADELGAHPDNLARGASALERVPLDDVVGAGRLAAMVANTVVGEALQRQDQVTLVQAFDQLTLALNKEVVGEMILRLAVRLMRAPGALVRVARDEPTPHVHAHLEAEDAAVRRLLEGAAERSQRTGRPFSVPDLSESLWARKHLGEMQVPAGLVMAAPFRRGHDSHGAVAVFSPRARADLEGDLHKLVLLGAQAAVSLDLLDRLLHSQERAIRDDLTGLFNQRYLREQLTRELSRSVRYGHPLSLIVIDIDRFKEINDKFGHPAGDRAIQAVARAIEGSVRKANTVARYGGDEFVVVVPEAGVASATVVAEHLRTALQGIRIEGEKGEQLPPLTCSVGVAEFDREADNPLTLFSRADANLLAAKRSGRDCVVSA
jgi:diguanylate cyclase (GGDEF)-like protein